jgi:hypothetical protein
METLILQSGSPFAMVEIGLWFLFVVWALALHLCREQPAGRRDQQHRPGAW